MQPFQLVPLENSISKNAAVRIVGNSKGDTIILLHSFSTSSQLYAPQFNSSLAEKYNLVAVDLLGHGDTAGIGSSLDYWDQAKMVLNVMRELKIEKAFVLGTSQGGFISTRMALLEPNRVLGMIICGTSLKKETPLMGCWDMDQLLAGALPVLQSEKPTPDFVLPQAFTDDIIRVGFNEEATAADKRLWRGVHEKIFVGDEGRRRYLMIIMALRNRDDLTATQLASITCPILIPHGTADVVYSIESMEKWAAQLTSSKVQKEIIQGGTHFLSATSAPEVNELVSKFVAKYGKASS